MYNSGGCVTIVIFAIAVLSLLWPVIEVIALSAYVIIRTLVSIVSSIIFAPFIIIWVKICTLWGYKNAESSHHRHQKKHHHRYYNNNDPTLDDEPEYYSQHKRRRIKNCSPPPRAVLITESKSVRRSSHKNNRL